MRHSSDNPLAINGLVDNRRAAEILGIPTATFRTWAARSKTAKSGVAAAMPQPVATMHGNVYRVEDIERFGREVAAVSRAPRSEARSNGRYFTPDAATRFMVNWAIRDEHESILEPSVGDGQFTIAAEQLAVRKGWSTLDVRACEIDPDVAARAIESGTVAPNKLYVRDFLAAEPVEKVDVVIGNPPFLRVRELDSAARRNAESAVRAAMGRTMDPAGSAWMPFVAKSASLLNRGGRLAMVLPLDFTYVRYARPLWDFLGSCFGNLTVVRFRERVFAGILQNVLILLAEEAGGHTDHVRLVAKERIAQLSDSDLKAGVRVSISDIADGSRPFQRALLPPATRDVLGILEQHSTVAGDRVKFNIGYVSGNKKFFHPSLQTIEKFALPPGSLEPTVVTSRQLAGAGLRTSSVEPSDHLWLPSGTLTPGEKRYVIEGESQGIDMAYKCRIRKPWYVVPGVRKPDVLLTAFSDRPRLYLNDAGWVASNSVLCGFMKDKSSAEQFIGSWYTPLTLLSSELQIHSLGGGVMIAVPSEADAVRVLDAASTKAWSLQEIDRSLQSGDATAAYMSGSGAIETLVGSEGVGAVLEGVDVLAKWRKAQV